MRAANNHRSDSEELFFGKLLHDPSSGFHDIKPLPEFHPLPLGLIAGLLAAALAGALSAYWYRKQGRGAASGPATPPSPPHVRALEELRELERSSKRRAVSVDMLSARASITLRTYIEEILGFGATDCTTKELLAQLPSRLAAAPIGFDPQAAGTRARQAGVLFEFFDYLSFAADAAVRYPVESSAVQERLEQAIALVHTLQEQIDQYQQSIRLEAKSNAV